MPSPASATIRLRSISPEKSEFGEVVFRLEGLQHERADLEHEQERFVGDPRAPGTVEVGKVEKISMRALCPRAINQSKLSPVLAIPTLKKIVCRQLAVITGQALRSPGTRRERS